MRKGTLGTIRVLNLNKRAAKESERLFQGLECFVNLGDSHAECQAFAAQWPSFWPVNFVKAGTDEPLGFLLDNDYRVLVRVFRDHLRRVWRFDSEALREQVAKILLGLARQSAVERHDSPQPAADSDYTFSLLRVGQAHPGYQATWPVITTDWVRGDFSYAPLNDFQRAVYMLFRESWRARSCPECGRLFVAAKPAQLYCSVNCSIGARRKRDLALWRTKGASKRRKRSNQFRSKGGK